MADKKKLIFDMAVDPKGFREAANNFSRDLNKAAQKWSKEVKSLFGDAVGDGFQYAMTQGQSGRAIKSFVKSNLTQVYSEFHKSLREGNAEAAQKYQNILEKRARTFKRELDAMAAANERILSRQDQSFSQRADSFNQALNNVGRGGVGGIFDAVRGMGGRAQDLGMARQQQGAQLQARASKMGDKAGMAQGAKMAQMGKTIATIGKAAMGIAAVAAILVTLVKLFADLESKVKDMNKALMDGAGAADFGLTPIEIRAGGLRRALENLRDETTGVNENFKKFRASAKEQQSILATFNQAGITYGKMNEQIKKGSKFMENYSDVTALAITYSRNLGIESSTIAKDMGTLADVTGQNLEEVAESFSIIQREATMSGFMTKRFYSAIVEATSGMAFYGVRIAETTDLLKNFDSLLGEAAGTEVFKKIAREGGKSFQDSLKEFLIKDPQFAKEQYQTVYRQRLADLERSLAGTDFEDIDLEKLLRETGGGAALAKRLEGMGITGQRGTDIMQLAELQQAARGNMTAMMGARGAAGPAFEAVMKLRTMPGLGGASLGEVYEKAVSEGNEGLLVALQQLAQSQGKDFDELKVLDQKNAGRFDYLKDVAAGNAEMTEELKNLGFYVEGAGTANAKIMRGTMDRAGNLIEESGVELRDRFDLLLTRPTEDGKALEKQLTQDQQIAAEISRNITGLNEIMEQTVTAILNDIYDVLIQIADWLFKDDPDRQAELHLQEKMAEDSKEANDNLRDLTKEQDALVAKQERGEELSKQEQKRMKELPDEIAEAMDEADIAQTASDLSKMVEGSEINEKGLGEIRRGLREEAGDVVAGTPGAKKAVEDVKKRAEQATAGLGGPWKGAPDWALGIEDYTGWMRPGAGVQALGSRVSTNLGLAGWQTKQSAKLGRFFGVDQYEGMSDAEIEAMGDAVQRGSERALQDRSIIKDFLGIGTASAQKNQAKFAEREVESTLLDQGEDQVSILKGMKETLENLGYKDLLGSAKKPNDALILPDKGAPIIPHQDDTIAMFKPGGPIAAGMGGGGGSPVTVNIYGGDPQKVYDQVMRVMKTLGHA